MNKLKRKNDIWDKYYVKNWTLQKIADEYTITPQGVRAILLAEARRKALELLSTTTLETILDELSTEREWIKEDKEVEDFHGLVAEVWKLKVNNHEQNITKNTRPMKQNSPH